MSGTGVCEWAPNVGYRCYSDRGNWTTLKHLNRPAVLELIDSRGRRHYAAAMQIQDREVILDFGDNRFVPVQNRPGPFLVRGLHPGLENRRPSRVPFLKEGMSALTCGG